MAEIERKYALTKIAAGDYLLPANDAQSIWRIRRYEDGPSLGLDMPTDRWWWGAWRWIGDLLYVDVGDWMCWDLWEQHCESRGEAIQSALASSSPEKEPDHG